MWCDLMTHFKVLIYGLPGTMPPCWNVKFFALFKELFLNCAINPGITAAGLEGNVPTKTK